MALIDLLKGKRRILIAACLFLLILQTEGCYYMQAIRGHTDLMHRRRPVMEVIEDETSPEVLREKLQLVRKARDFAVTDLLLPENESYRSYADLQRDYVVWNVFAAPEFSLEPKTWCYPVAGCVAYRGYFNEDKARKLAASLVASGNDVSVGGVSAYSTLGRFADPVLNTMMRWSDVDLVATIFHELAHQKLYIKGDSAFNESFATTIADVGIERWLSASDTHDPLNDYRQSKELRRSMMALVGPAREQLAALYAEEIDAASMRVRKKLILDQLSADADTLIAGSSGATGNWLAAPLNNARLVSLNLYEGLVGAFNAILQNCDRVLACFYEESEKLAALSAEQRQAQMNALANWQAVEKRNFSAVCHAVQDVPPCSMAKSH